MNKKNVKNIKKIEVENNKIVTKKPSSREQGGGDSPDPTRYGDWEKGGRCIDF